MYMKSLAQDWQAKCDAPTMKVNVTQFVGGSLLLFHRLPVTHRKMQREVNQHFKFIQIPTAADARGWRERERERERERKRERESYAR